MSIEIAADRYAPVPASLLQRRDLKLTDIRLWGLISILSWGGKKPSAHSQEALAEWLDVAKTTVQESLKRLANLELIIEEGGHRQIHTLAVVTQPRDSVDAASETATHSQIESPDFLRQRGDSQNENGSGEVLGGSPLRQRPHSQPDSVETASLTAPTHPRGLTDRVPHKGYLVTDRRPSESEDDLPWDGGEEDQEIFRFATRESPRPLPKYYPFLPLRIFRRPFVTEDQIMTMARLHLDHQDQLEEARERLQDDALHPDGVLVVRSIREDGSLWIQEDQIMTTEEGLATGVRSVAPPEPKAPPIRPGFYRDGTPIEKFKATPLSETRLNSLG